MNINMSYFNLIWAKAWSTNTNLLNYSFSSLLNVWYIPQVLVAALLWPKFCVCQHSQFRISARPNVLQQLKEIIHASKSPLELFGYFCYVSMPRGHPKWPITCHLEMAAVLSEHWGLVFLLIVCWDRFLCLCRLIIHLQLRKPWWWYCLPWPQTAGAAGRARWLCAELSEQDTGLSD